MNETMNTAPATVAIPGYLAGTWKADPAHSDITFSVRQLMVSTVRGRFTGYDVTIVTGEDPLGSSVAATIDLGAITIPMGGDGVVSDKVSITLKIQAVLQT